MPKTFIDLPVALRLLIFKLAVKGERLPRDVEVVLKDGLIYPNRPPPALLHVNRESRYVTLKFYKPWLPQYEGTAAYKPWVGVENASSLENVCIDLKRDTLVLRGRITSLLRLLGPLERSHLRSVAINVWDMFEIAPLARNLLSLKNLEYLRLFGVEDCDGLAYKETQLARYLQKEQENGSMKTKTGVNYAPPKIYSQASTPNLILLPQTRQWTTYKYPVGYKPPNGVRPDLIGEESDCLRPIRPTKRKADSQNASLKRKAQTKLELGQKRRRRRSNLGRFMAADPIPTSMDRSSNKEETGSVYRAPDLDPSSISRSSSVDIPDQILAQLQADFDNTRTSRDPQLASKGGAEFDDGQKNNDGNILPGITQSEIHASPPNKSTDGEEDLSEYVLDKFMAERHTPQGLEILVQWKHYPLEKDWTWETSSSLAESVPEMLKQWYSRAALSDSAKEEEKVSVNVVEEILSRHTRKGVLYYLVKWEGYPNVKDRTWELAERLKADVPFLVDEFERKWKRKWRAMRFSKSM
ncbi:uncharacterized protein BP5553_03675 [Venustampulla echinocandica]|uniref:Chromo domain-containing protein n=1 Tax=Venustampulla echinocandica TaxID=2656787 RepID=A0A370TUX0_9HELO|nr:uncharacterized protein BP5553_03675 [Venustampulla echinocandica]RDL39335.1 hypothetical protein BP5553_03675 [Venustampulla echinocandica]